MTKITTLSITSNKRYYQINKVSIETVSKLLGHTNIKSPRFIAR
jgi:hypothetical protein